MRSTPRTARVSGPDLTFVIIAVLLVGPRGWCEEVAPRADLLVVELFTSQGCSSCPPADRLLRRLAGEGRIASRELVPLAFHVDYWNHLGWRDPFSSARWSKRQRNYADVLPSGRSFTPQAVLNGRVILGGWDEQGIRQAAERLPPVTPILFESVARDPLRVRIVQPALAAAGVLFVARVESGFETAVARGENADRKLRNDHVVTAASEVILDPTKAGESLVVELPGKDTIRTGVVVVLAREVDSRAILAAGQRSLVDDD